MANYVLLLKVSAYYGVQPSVYLLHQAEFYSPDLLFLIKPSKDLGMALLALVLNLTDYQNWHTTLEHLAYNESNFILCHKTLSLLQHFYPSTF